MGSYHRLCGTAYCKGEWDLQSSWNQAGSRLPARPHVYQVLGLKDALKPVSQFSRWCPLLPSMYRGIQKICLAGRYPSSFVQLKQYLVANKAKFWPQAQCDFLLLWFMPLSCLPRAWATACLVPEVCKAICSFLGWGQNPGSPGLSPPPSPCAGGCRQCCISERLPATPCRISPALTGNSWPMGCKGDVAACLLPSGTSWRIWRV